MIKCREYWLRMNVHILCILFIVSILMSACSASINPIPQATATSVPNKLFSEVAPPSTPLICPHQSGTGQNTFVKKDGSIFTYHGSPIKFYGYTFYPSSSGGASAWHTTTFTHYIDHIMTMGSNLGQNLIRPTDYWDIHDSHPEQGSENIWRNIDYLVCTAQQHSIFVELDVSAFQKVLISQHLDAFNPDNWKTFLTAVGKHYTNQSAVAFYSIVGEPQVPNNSDELNTLVNFYRVTTDTLRAADSHHLITAGGFNHMEQETPDLPWWHDIYSLPNNDIAAFKTYSLDDLHLIPTIAAFAKQIGKPAFDEEFGMPQSLGDAAFTGGAGFEGIQTSRAQFYQDVYTIGEPVNIQGFVFWDLGCDLRSDSYQINPNTPAVWQVVGQHGPNKPTMPSSPQSFCS